MDIQRRWLAVPLAAAAVSGAVSAGNGKGKGEEQEIPFEEARLFFELNDTDGDLGIHDGRELDGEVRLSHVLAAPPANIRVATIPAAANCDVEPLPSVRGPVIIDWDPVTKSHPMIGKSGPLAVDHYELVVEREGPQLLIFSVKLPPELTQFEAPDAFIALGDAFKFEIIVRATNGNQTDSRRVRGQHVRCGQTPQAQNDQ